MENNSEELVRRIRVAVLPWTSHITEKRMFGSACFLFKGKMCVGETKERLMVRVVSEKMPEMLKNPYVQPMDFTGKPMKEFIFVTKEGFDTEEKLQQWVELGIEHAHLKST
ncbi:TfoX/Sxy family transcriptional regulator of competence genes [Ulvibacter sp. MAR_2010_11]|uniref:TfoX/Sxy family protein n=1 Tax=Ulvibacter sp. MAR_2010_11 TaxID=1250229 RepID=UPI000C2CC46E|nr:TfoX/Sxy family protein [Ulvibacter sp. MAR_2010_11]PKA84230.1 TfoX/Sxy family transcriptional regulator of competence genes [Ulvibacter sp. MAR_2010_11]